MRKCSSFMCVLVVLLAGGAEASRPLPMEAIVGILGLVGQASATGWDSCQRFDQIYANGEELCEVMWNDAFEYTTNESAGYNFWWFEGGSAGAADPIPNPNDEVARLLGLTPPVLNDQCGLVYYHKSTVTPEPHSFTECHPWHSGSCCNNATVMTPTAINTGYGPGFRWDRCGPLSQACERFFVMEACFYECEPTAGLYRKYTDAQFNACNPTGGYGAGSPAGTAVTLADGSSYTCLGDENQWQIYRMPIKASFCDSWFRACAEDLFCGGGNYFECANDFHADDGGYRARLDALARQEAAARNASAAAQAQVTTLEAQLSDEQDVNSIVIIICVAGGICALVVLILCIALVCFERQGKPVFKPVDAPVDGPKMTTSNPDSKL